MDLIEFPKLLSIREENTMPRDIQIPFIIYAGSSIKEHVDMAIEHGAQGCTNNPMELFELVIKNLL